MYFHRANLKQKLTNVRAALMGIMRFLLTVLTVAVAAARHIGLKNIFRNYKFEFRSLEPFVMVSGFLFSLSALLFTMTLCDSCAHAVAVRIEAGAESSNGRWTCQPPVGQRGRWARKNVCQSQMIHPTSQWCRTAGLLSPNLSKYINP